MLRPARVFIFVVLPLAVAGVPARAADVVTEEQFLAAVEAGHPALVALEDQVRAAAAGLAAAGVLRNPDVAVSREEPEGLARQTNWSLAWTPPWDGRRRLAVESAEAGLEAARRDADAARHRLRLDLREVYAEWALAEERLRIAGSLLDQVRSLAARAGARALAGEESGLAARRLAFSAVEVAADVARADAGRDKARATVRAWNPGIDASAQPVLPALPEMPGGPSSASRADLEALRLRATQAEIDRRLGRRFFPAPRLDLGWQEIDDGASRLDGPVLGVGWSFPLFDRRQGERLEAAGRLQIARARLEWSTTRVDAEIDGARSAYDRLRRAALETAAATAGSETMVEAAATAFRLGEGSVTDLLETVRSVRAARTVAFELHGEALAALRALEAALGRSLPEGSEDAP